MTPRDFLSDGNEPVSEPTNEKLEPRDFLAEPPKESFGTSLAMAVPRMGEDLIKGGYQALQKVPEYYQAAKREIPGAINSLRFDPQHALGQGVAGLAEAGQNIFNLPHDVANYATNRLNLIPEDVNKKIQMARMPDSEEAINERFGEPLHVGEKLIRGIGRNALNIGTGLGAARTLNPLNLTNRGVARNVVAEQNRQIASHTNMYNNLWRDADRAGINQVPVNPNLVQTNLDFIRQYKSPRDYRTLEYFNQHPTLPNAQSALSDLRTMRRGLDEKSRTASLTGEERNLYDALHHTEQHIENNMFLNPNGARNEGLANRYRNITNSYRENVVPYRYNKDIQAYINRELTAKQLVQRLNTGEFAAKKASAHPAFAVRNAILPVAGGIGTLGGAKYLYDQAMGNNGPKQ